MKRFVPVSVLILFSTASINCLVARELDISCSRDSTATDWTVTRTLRGLGSDDSTAREEALEGLLALWKDPFSYPDTSEGTVLERSLWVEGIDVHGRTVQRTRGLPREFEWSDDSTSLEFRGGKATSEIVETNGTVSLDEDSTVVIRWPADSKLLHARLRSFEPLYGFSKEERERIVREGARTPSR